MSELRADLRRWVEDRTGDAVVDASPIGKGASRRTWGVGLADGRRVVVREDTGTGPTSGTPLDLAREATVYRALGSSGLPVPALLDVAPDGTAMLLEWAHGSADLSAATEADRALVATDYLRCLGRLHLLEPGQLDLGPLEVPAGGPDHALVDIALWQSIHAAVDRPWRSDAASLGLAWLAEHPPAEATRTSLCHGDAGPLNFLYDGDAVTALLDWEFAHVGDPLDDLAWVAVRNHMVRARIDLPSVFAAWRQTTGCELDPARLEFYRALVLVRMLVSCDATVRWSDGRETDESRTQVLLRPLLAQCIGQALRRAGCDDPSLATVEREAAVAWAASPLVRAFGEEPQLEDFGALR
jgi:aminoglycoside phosphotransferase (APT) family kinase protein